MALLVALRVLKYAVIATMATLLAYYCYQLGLHKGYLRGYVMGTFAVHDASCHGG